MFHWRIEGPFHRCYASSARRITGGELTLSCGPFQLDGKLASVGSLRSQHSSVWFSNNNKSVFFNLQWKSFEAPYAFYTKRFITLYARYVMTYQYISNNYKSFNGPPLSNDWFALSDLGAGGSLHCHLWRKGNNQLASCHCSKIGFYSRSLTAATNISSLPSTESMNRPHVIINPLPLNAAVNET